MTIKERLQSLKENAATMEIKSVVSAEDCVKNIKQLIKDNKLEEAQTAIANANTILDDKQKAEVREVYDKALDKNKEDKDNTKVTEKKESIKSRLSALKELQRYGNVKGRNVYIMDKVKTKQGYVAVQDLKTGHTYEIPEKEVKNISTKYPESLSTKSLNEASDTNFVDLDNYIFKVYKELKKNNEIMLATQDRNELINTVNDMKNTLQDLENEIKKMGDFEESLKQKKKCPKCGSEVWDISTPDQRLNKCHECGLKFDNEELDGQETLKSKLVSLKEGTVDNYIIKAKDYLRKYPNLTTEEIKNKIFKDFGDNSLEATGIWDMVRKQRKESLSTKGFKEGVIFRKNIEDAKKYLDDKIKQKELKSYQNLRKSTNPKLEPINGQYAFEFDTDWNKESIKSKLNALKESSNFNQWFDTFLEEKDLQFQQWDIEDSQGQTHIIDSDVVIEAIKNASESEQNKIKDMIVKLDFQNANIMDYFKHLAKALIETQFNESIKEAMFKTEDGKLSIGDKVKCPSGKIGKIINITKDLVSVNSDGVIKAFDKDDLTLV